MSDIAPISGAPLDRMESVSAPGVRSTYVSRGAERPTDTRPSDRVDISDRARYLSRLTSMPDIRQDLVDRVRAEIASGSYDTDEKFEEAIQSLIDDLEP